MTRFTVATGHVVKAIMAVMCTKLGPSAAVSSAAVEGLGNTEQLLCLFNDSVFNKQLFLW